MNHIHQTIKKKVLFQAIVKQKLCLKGLKQGKKSRLYSKSKNFDEEIFLTTLVDLFLLFKSSSDNIFVF